MTPSEKGRVEVGGDFRAKRDGSKLNKNEINGGEVDGGEIDSNEIGDDEDEKKVQKTSKSKNLFKSK